MKWGELWRGFAPLLLTFSIAQLTLQVDLVMLSRLGEHATTACIALMRIAMLDMILTMAIGSVTSVIVSQARRAERADQTVRQALSVAAMLGAAAACIGLLFYPRLAIWLMDSAEVSGLVADAVSWYSLAIPFRLVATTAIYALHAMGAGKSVVYWKLLEVGLKALSNWLLIFVLALGFKGSYMAGLVVSLLGCGWSLNRLRQHMKVGFRIPEPAWARDFLRQIGWEAQRMLSAQLFALLAFMLFASSWFAPVDLARLGAYAAGAALMLFLFAPLVAMLRALAFQLAGSSMQTMFSTFNTLCWIGVPMIALLAAGLYLGGDWLGQVLYAQQGGRWWSTLIAILALSLPVRYLNNLQRALFQARQEFAPVARADSFTTWGIGLPLIVTGLSLDSPMLAYSHLLLPELCCALWLWRHLLMLYRGSRTDRDKKSTLQHQQM